jgi:hypothetical protein
MHYWLCDVCHSANNEYTRTLSTTNSIVDRFPVEYDTSRRSNKCQKLALNHVIYWGGAVGMGTFEARSEFNNMMGLGLDTQKRDQSTLCKTDWTKSSSLSGLDPVYRPCTRMVAVLVDVDRATNVGSVMTLYVAAISSKSSTSIDTNRQLAGIAVAVSAASLSNNGEISRQGLHHFAVNLQTMTADVARLLVEAKRSDHSSSDVIVCTMPSFRRGEVESSRFECFPRRTWLDAAPLQQASDWVLPPPLQALLPSVDGGAGSTRARN